MHFRHSASWALALGFLMLTPLKAQAWGVEGHEVVALMALTDLSPVARAQVTRLLGSGAMLAHEANWADEIRDARPQTGSWHYVDIPLQATGYDALRDCARRACVVAQIADQRRILADRKRSDRTRADALRFLIHLAGDVHQPLHAANNNDKGGNRVRARLGRQWFNLHRVWDAEVVEALGFDAARVAATLRGSVTPAERKAWQSGTPVQWANEAHGIARDRIYPPLQGRREVRLPRDYAARMAPITRTQLSKAGVRLAWLLNSALR